MKKFFIFILLLISFSFSATIKGVVYLPDLSEANGSVLIINTTPEQIFVLKNASYSIEVPDGSYNISIFYEMNSVVLHDSENLVVEGNGTYNIDFILVPPIDEDIGDLNFDEFDFPITEENPRTIFSYIGDILIILLSVLVIIYLLRKKPMNIQPSELPEDLKLLLKLVASNDGRITQKELRQELKWSEAKLSLAIAELEHLGYVKKIKKGRGNIIILKLKKEELNRLS